MSDGELEKMKQDMLKNAGMWRVFYVCWLKPKITRAKKMLGMKSSVGTSVE